MSSLECWPADKLRWHILILIVVCIPLDSGAAEWLSQPRVSLITEYNDNKRLTEDAHDNVLGTQLDITGKMGMQTEKTEINIVPRAIFSKYSGEKNLDSNDYFLDFSSLLITEKTYWRFNVNYVRDTSLVSELEDTGRVQTRKTREKIMLIPSLIYEFSDRTNLKTTFNFLQVGYMDAGIIGLVDYNYKTTDIAVVTETGDKGELSVSLNVSQFEAADVSNQSDHVSLSAMYRRSLTDSMESEVLFGVRESDFNSKQYGDKNGILFRLGINKEYEQTTWKVELSRMINPAGSGSMVERDRVSANVSRSMTDKLKSSIRVSLLKQKNLANEGRRRRYSQFDVGLHWQVTDYWSMRGGYRYRYNGSSEMLNAVDSNALVFEFIYFPPEKLSRHTINN